MVRVAKYNNSYSGRTIKGYATKYASKGYGYDKCVKCGADSDSPCVKTKKLGTLDYGRSEFCKTTHPERKRRAFTIDELNAIERIRVDRPTPHERFLDTLPSKPENCLCLYLDKMTYTQRYQVFRRQACRYLAENCEIHKESNG